MSDLELRTLEDFEPSADLGWRLVAQSPDGILVCDTAGTVVLANDRIEELFGYDPGELVGCSIEDLVPARARTAHTKHRSRFNRAPLLRPMGAGLELFGLRKDGTEFPLDISLGPVSADGGGYTLACVRDISARTAAQQRVMEIARLVGRAAHALFIADVESLRFSYCNEAAAKLTGYGHDVLLTMTLMDLDPTLSSASEGNARLESIIDGAVDSTTRGGVVRRKDGLDIPVEITTNVVDPRAGESPQVLLLVTDITDRLRAEESLRTSAEELRVSDERDRIARDLHDTVIQRLFAAGMRLQAVAGQIDEAHVAERVEAAVDDIDATIGEIRSTIFDVQSRAVGQSDFRAAILDIVHELEGTLAFEPRVQFNFVENPRPDIIGHALPTLREALTNVAKHADAKNTDVIIEVVDDAWFELRVVDDGVGPLHPDDEYAPTKGTGHGLRNVDARARELGGTSNVEQLPTGGTALTWRVPLHGAGL